MRRRITSRFFNRNQVDESTALLSCRRVTKNFGALVAVNKLSFDINAGTVFGIGGPNGAGKTTLYDVITGISPADSGEVLLKGRQITRMRPHQVCHAGIARTFQLNAAFETMTVIENVMVSAHHGLTGTEVPKLYYDKEERQRALNAIELTGLADKADAVASSLNLLDHKLLMIASAVATRPSLLLMDEPVGGLIPREIDQVEKIVRGLIDEYGMTVVLIEHVMRFLVGLSDEIMIMNYGEKLYQGSPQGLSEDRKVVEIYLGEGASGKVGGSRDTSGGGSVPDEELQGDPSPKDKWSNDVEVAARKLLRQYTSGRVYPIDYLQLDRLLEEKGEGDKSTQVSRAASAVVEAHNSNQNEQKAFEWLRRVFEESHSLRREVRSDEKLQQSEQARSSAIEEAARTLLDQEGRGDIRQETLNQLRAALMWQVATGVDRKVEAKDV